ncbi:TetR/AcrR family transcriptional regulator [Seongchinamella unica]|uniref:TetR/AcrR family transcriptional regulator n=1 Tax=Seongchinamella unica TaxID=2547392 RepID=A0A4R5LNY0_9GAMM|nr:TetR/AcrR family transcriptional regulator [Seongchinamella unica]TDG12073.1 TetR/AcrR family transcriptional regulator [Seongchinamella unica]
MTVSRRQVELLEKNRPRQERAKRTYEAILAAAAELLVEVGVERISTNLIAERAGITVPALYRYFPNKYAVINALGAGLMDRQNEIFREWVETYYSASQPERLLSHIYEVLRKTYDVTLEQTGGLEISQALRAVGPLQELRLDSHRLLADELAIYLAELQQQETSAETLMQARLTVDLGYSLVEMALEDPTLTPDLVLRQGADMLAAAWQNTIPGSAVDTP